MCAIRKETPMASVLDDKSLDQLFRHARSIHAFTAETVADETIHELYELLKWGPTAFNVQPARFVFLKSRQARERLAPALSHNNRDKTLAAPLTVIAAYDMQFYEHSKETFPFSDVAGIYEKAPTMIEPTALRNGSLQAAYLILAARALGLAAGPMSGFNPGTVNQEFFPDGRFRCNILVNLGYYDGSPMRARTPRLTFDVAAQIL
jgi:3-hydroxypropanoate dehydrogenase